MKLNAASRDVTTKHRSMEQHSPICTVRSSSRVPRNVDKLEQQLNIITGFGTTFKPNSGAQEEYAGLMVISIPPSRGDHQETLLLIPSSAHGTNPASAAMAGMKVVVTKH
jgi:glycine dehydrogenase